VVPGSGFVVDEVVERIKDGTITQYVYDAKTAALVELGGGVFDSGE